MIKVEVYTKSGNAASRAKKSETKPTKELKKGFFGRLYVFTSSRMRSKYGESNKYDRIGETIVYIYITHFIITASIANPKLVMSKYSPSFLTTEAWLVFIPLDTLIP